MRRRWLSLKRLIQPDVNAVLEQEHCEKLSDVQGLPESRACVSIVGALLVAFPIGA